LIGIRSFIAAAVALAIATIIALLFDDTTAAWWLAACILVISGYHAYYLTALHHWAALPRNRELPLGVGTWSAVMDRLSRAMRQDNDSRLELSAELDRVHAAVDQLPDGLVVLDRFDHVEWSNNAAEKLHGIFGRKRPIHHYVRQPEFIEFLEQAVYTKPVRISLPAQPGHVFEIGIFPIADGQKLMVTRDITDQAKLDAVRRDFVANVSHEIRTPVTVIGGFAETLLNLDLDEGKRREYLATILKQSQNMQRLVEDLLILSSLENSTTVPTETNIDVAAMIATVATEARALSCGRHTIVETVESPCLLRGAPNEVESALRNLMTNAVRYTPEGGTVTMRWALRGDEAWLSVRDTGIGVSAEHIPRLTERFYRVESGRSRSTGGTGLGLAIVKHVVQRHGARLDVQSRLGEGSVFALVFGIERVLSRPSATLAAPLAVDAAGHTQT
jgi:two-component system, OmpR family, phosphate regulon sensor histidine kinase PhoR